MTSLLPYVLWDIQGAEQAETLAPVVTGETTPYPSEGSFCIPVIANAELATKMLSALYSGAEIMFPEMTLEIVVPFLQALNNLGDCAMGCIDGIHQIRRSNNWLQVEYCDNLGVWVNRINLGGTVAAGDNNDILFDLDGNGLVDAVIYQNSYQNIFSQALPITSEDDRLCRAAWALARQYTDSWDALLGIIEGTDTFLAGAVEMLAELGVITNLFDDTIEFLTEGWVEATIAFLRANSRTEQTVELAADLIFCALKESYPDDLDNFFNNIEFGAYAPIVSLVAGRKVQWGNFGDIATSIKNTGLGRFSAYLALGYASTSLYWLQTVVGVYKPASQIMDKAMKTAEYFDSRDCAGFECLKWTHEINFYSDDVDFTWHDGYAIVDGRAESGPQAATWSCGNCKRQIIQVSFEQIGSGLNYELTDVNFDIYTEQSTCEIRVLNWYGGTPALYENFACEDGDRYQAVTLPEGHKGLWLIVASNIIDSPSYPPSFQIKVTLQGTGENPFEA